MKNYYKILSYIFIYTLCICYINANNINNYFVNYAELRDKKIIKIEIDKLKKNDNNYTNQFALGLLYHNLALSSNDINDSETAIAFLNQSLENYDTSKESQVNGVGNSIIIMYLGSSYTLLGRDSKRIAQRVSSVNKGLGFMDRAIIIDNNNINLRIVRLENNILLPEMFARSKKILDDIEFLENVLGNKLSDRNKILLQKAYYQLALLEKDGSNNIKIYLNKAYNYLPTGDLANEIKKRLK